ncbi:MAG: Rpn family recombination-promoting nuclease/putative transposase [Planctomycetaceae bacterium]
MAIGISPTVDFAFKLMLGSPEHTGVTIHFLNSILDDQPRITQVEILNPFLGKEFEDDKLSVLDILATDEHGRLLNIEMQTSLSAALTQRLAYYASCLYVSQLKESSSYAVLRPAISICVLTQAMFPQTPALQLDFRLREKAGLILTDDLQIHLLELSKLQVTAQNVYSASPAERWGYFLRNAEQLTQSEIGRLFPDEEIAEAAGVLEMISHTPEQRMLYDARLKFQRDEESRLQEALKRGIQEGRQEGVIVGRLLLLQELLGVRPWAMDEFSGCNASQLAELEVQLKQQLRSRGQGE